jgi:hypothetical protein
MVIHKSMVTLVVTWGIQAPRYPNPIMAWGHYVMAAMPPLPKLRVTCLGP